MTLLGSPPPGGEAPAPVEGWIAKTAPRPRAATAIVRTTALNLGVGNPLKADVTDRIYGQLQQMEAVDAAIKAREIVIEITDSAKFKFGHLVSNERQLKVTLVVLTAGALTALRPLLQAGRAVDLGAGLSTGTIEWRDTALAHTLVVTGAPVEWSAEMIKGALEHNGLEVTEMPEPLCRGASPFPSPDWIVHNVMTTAVPAVIKVPASPTDKSEVRLALGIVTAAAAPLHAPTVVHERRHSETRV